LHLDHPVYGSRKLRVLLGREGWAVNRKRVVRLLQIMGIETAQRTNRWCRCRRTF
jgi:putative transposase